MFSSDLAFVRSDLVGLLVFLLSLVIVQGQAKEMEVKGFGICFHKHQGSL